MAPYLNSRKAGEYNCLYDSCSMTSTRQSSYENSRYSTAPSPSAKARGKSSVFDSWVGKRVVGTGLARRQRRTAGLHTRHHGIGSSLDSGLLSGDSDGTQPGINPFDGPTWNYLSAFQQRLLRPVWRPRRGAREGPVRPTWPMAFSSSYWELAIKEGIHCSRRSLHPRSFLHSPRLIVVFDSRIGSMDVRNGSLGWLVMAVWVSVSALRAQSSKFDELVQPSWATDHVIHDGELLKLKLDNSSGSGFASKSKYLFGKVTAELKLVEGDSAGTVTAFYMSSEGANHHEFDFEFLGNRTGEPYLVQTNLYINGVGNREQRMDLWFDPTTDFHAYSILWNPQQVVFLVDDTPIRVLSNRAASRSGIAFPGDQPMGVYSSIWNADDWATEGGRVKTDWSHAPFVATFRSLRIDGCEWAPGAEVAAELRRCSASEQGKEGRYWWKEKEMEVLTVHQSHQLIWARANHLVYDYCSDPGRFPSQPPECNK
ncbi:hypothetical protein ZIOFF_043052 [Zingiber officinale]|uniref:xyloglucan:xyloglucosyl transferase n=2 Tax=Zingiber officinale TaxID=94328 RepID=A0A8J5FUA8_ZINOF|nr:hypothetical protein ZIOFF_043052 [Zingiber officinale]